MITSHDGGSLPDAAPDSPEGRAPGRPAQALLPRLVYRINRNDAIISVDGPWHQFICSADAEVTARETTAGSCFWRYISGAATQQLYRELLAYVRRYKKAVELTYHRRLTTERRNLRLRLVPCGDGVVELQKTLLHVEQLATTAFSTHLPAISPTLVRCSLCQRWNVDDAWTDIVTAVTRGCVLALPAVLAYGVCDACMEAIRTQRLPSLG